LMGGGGFYKILEIFYYDPVLLLNSQLQHKDNQHKDWS
jgi:hypothetical protein